MSGEDLDKARPDLVLDLTGEPCPEPQIEITKYLKRMKEGQVLEVITDEEPVDVSIPYICEGKEYPCKIRKEGNVYRVRILKNRS